MLNHIVNKIESISCVFVLWYEYSWLLIYLQVPLRVSREGYSETAYIKWMLTGLDSSAAVVTLDDVNQMSGTLTFSSGIFDLLVTEN